MKQGALRGYTPAKTAVFSGSSSCHVQCPPDNLPEVALMGRSNVGKSTLINKLLGRKQLAKTSSKPGKTRLINHFLINEKWYLVDLPGYGWAQVGKVLRGQWSRMVRGYLLHRKQISLVCVLIDARHVPQESDLEMIRWLGCHRIPLHIVLTKSDKCNTRQVQKNTLLLQQALQPVWEVPPPILAASPCNSQGLDILWEHLQKALELHRASSFEPDC